MRRKILSIFNLQMPLVVMLLYTASCTHNDGDIGDLYGRWQLTEMHVGDSVARPNDIFFSFQSSVVFTSYCHYDIHEAQDFRGIYRREADSMLISYYTDTTYADKVQEFMTTRLGIADYTDVRLRVVALDDDRLRLSNDGIDWTFRHF